MGGWRTNFEKISAKRHGSDRKQFVTQKEEAKLLDYASSAASASFRPYADMSPSHHGKCQHYHSRWCPTCHVTARQQHYSDGAVAAGRTDPSVT